MHDLSVDVTGATPARVVTPDPGWLNGMDFGPDGFIYAPRWTEGTIVRVDPETGERRPLGIQDGAP